MKFQFLVDIGGAPYINAGTIDDLSPEQVEKYRGRNDNHLLPMDKEAIEYIETHPIGGPAKDVEPEPVEEPKDEEPKAEEKTRDQLVEEAKALKIPGAAQMKKEDLAAAIAAVKA